MRPDLPGNEPVVKRMCAPLLWSDVTLVLGEEYMTEHSADAQVFCFRT